METPVESRMLESLRGALYGALTFMALGIGCAGYCAAFAALQVRESVASAAVDVHSATVPVISAANAVTAQVDAVGASVSLAGTQVVGVAGSLRRAIDATSHRLNDLCPEAGAQGAALRPCGTLADVDKTLATGRGTLGQVEVTARELNLHAATFYAQEATSAKQVEATMTDVQRFVTQPDLYAAVENVNAATASVAGTAVNLDATTTDARTWLHQRLFPTKKRGFVSGFEATGDVVRHWMPSLF